MMLLPGTMAGIASLGALAGDGRCKAFDAGADGYGRGEGVALALVAPAGTWPSDAPPLGRFRGSAVLQAGTASSLTAPSGPAQAAVVRAALADARVDSRDVASMATHGTGTPLGDPLELGALAAALGRGSRAAPLALAAPKARLGHTEGAAGALGMLWALMCASQGGAPPVARLAALNPHAAAALADWRGAAAPPRGAGPAAVGGVAGASSFGMSGVNAHALVAAPREPPLARSDPLYRRAVAWPVPRPTLEAGRHVGNAVFELDLRSPALAFLGDHAVAGTAILPATAALEAAAAAAGAMLAPDTPLVILGTALMVPCPVAGVLVVAVDATAGAVVLRARGGAPTARGSFAALPRAAAGESIKHSRNTPRSSSALRRPGRAAVRRRVRRRAAATAAVRGPPAGVAGFLAHPAAADATLHLAAALGSGNGLLIPAVVGAAWLRRARGARDAPAGALRATAVTDETDDGGALLGAAGQAASGRLAVALARVAARAPPPRAEPPAPVAPPLDMLYETEWQVVEPAADRRRAGRAAPAAPAARLLSLPRRLPPVAATAALLAALQGAPTGVTAVTTLGRDARSAGAAAALARVAAGEAPAAGLAALAVDAACDRRARADAHALATSPSRPVGGAFGTRVAAGAAAAARLLPARERAPRLTSGSTPAPAARSGRWYRSRCRLLARLGAWRGSRCARSASTSATH